VIAVVSGLHTAVNGNVHSGGNAQSIESEWSAIGSLFFEYWCEHGEVCSVRFGEAHGFGSCAGNSEKAVSRFPFLVSRKPNCTGIGGRDVCGREMNAVRPNG
jgi:hypothetical protein